MSYNKNMKRLLLILVFALCFFMASPMIAYCETMPEYVRVIYDNIGIYSTTQIFNLDSNQLENVTVETATLHEVLKISGEDGDFYVVEKNKITGYVLKTLVISNSQKSPVKKLDTNATTKNDSLLFTKPDKQSPANKTLSKDTPVKILDGYDKDKEFTMISFQENETVYTYFVETKNLSVPGINYTAIIAVSTIFAGVSIALMLFKIIKPKPLVKN